MKVSEGDGSSKQKRKGVLKDSDIYKFVALCPRTLPKSYTLSGVEC